MNSTSSIICALILTIITLRYNIDERVYLVMLIAIIGLMLVKEEGKKKKG